MSSPAITLYVAQNCALCAAAERLVGRLAGEIGFAWRAIDIATDPELERRFLLEVPVIEVDGAVVAAAPLREAALRDVLVELLAR